MASTQVHVPANRSQAWIPAQLTPPGLPFAPLQLEGLLHPCPLLQRPSTGPWQSESICFQSFFSFFLIRRPDDFFFKQNMLLLWKISALHRKCLAFAVHIVGHTRKHLMCFQIRQGISFPIRVEIFFRKQVLPSLHRHLPQQEASSSVPMPPLHPWEVVS